MFMQHLKKLFILFLLLIGLFYSPTVSYENNASVAMKFESGLNVKKDLATNVCTKNIDSKKNKSRSDSDFILSEHRIVFFKLSSNPIFGETSLSQNSNYFQSSNYLQKAKYLSHYYKDIHQLNVLLI